MDDFTVTLKPGEVAINFKKFDGANPPVDGHYLVLCEDEMMQFDYYQKKTGWLVQLVQTEKSRIIAYAKIIKENLKTRC